MASPSPPAQHTLPTNAHNHTRRRGTKSWAWLLDLDLGSGEIPTAKKSPGSQPGHLCLMPKTGRYRRYLEPCFHPVLYYLSSQYERAPTNHHTTPHLRASIRRARAFPQLRPRSPRLGWSSASWSGWVVYGPGIGAVYVHAYIHAVSKLSTSNTQACMESFEKTGLKQLPAPGEHPNLQCHPPSPSPPQGEIVTSSLAEVPKVARTRRAIPSRELLAPTTNKTEDSACSSGSSSAVLPTSVSICLVPKSANNKKTSPG